MAEKISKRYDRTNRVQMDSEYALDPKNPLDASLIGAQIRFNAGAESAQDVANAAEMTSAFKVKNPNNTGPKTVFLAEVYKLTNGTDTIEVSKEACDMFRDEGWKLTGVTTRKIQG